MFGWSAHPILQETLFACLDWVLLHKLNPALPSIGWTYAKIGRRGGSPKVLTDGRIPRRRMKWKGWVFAVLNGCRKLFQNLFLLLFPLLQRFSNSLRIPVCSWRVAKVSRFIDFVDFWFFLTVFLCACTSGGTLIKITVLDLF